MSSEVCLFIIKYDKKIGKYKSDLWETDLRGLDKSRCDESRVDRDRRGTVDAPAIGILSDCGIGVKM